MPRQSCDVYPYLKVSVRHLFAAAHGRSETVVAKGLDAPRHQLDKKLTPDEAQAAFAALDKQPAPDTVRGILEMRAMREALQAKMVPPKRQSRPHRW